MSFNLNVRQSVESSQGIDLVKNTSYGPENKKADVVLLSPHSGNSRQLVERLSGAFADKPDVLDDYLTIDADFGADDLAHAIAQEIAVVGGDLRVDVAQVLYERGIVDPNRVPSVAVRNVLDYGHGGLNKDFLRSIHSRTLEIVEKILGQIDETKGIFLDIHSMAPYSPVNLIGEQPGRLGAYSYPYRNRSQRGGRRFLDLITDIPGQGVIANPIILANVQDSLTSAGQSFRRNNPYPKPGYPAQNIMGTRYMVKHAGLALDYPKDSLTKGVAEDDGWDIANLEVDGNKVEHVAKILAGAVIQSLKGIRA